MLALIKAIALRAQDDLFQAYRRTLGNLGPGRGLSGTDDNGAHVGIAGSSRAAGNAQSGEHDGDEEWKGRKGKA